MGLRPRAATGRNVVPEASKWEVLVHIADVSDIYLAKDGSTEREEFIQLNALRSAARKRGTSRYDLPFGPLHLLPPKVLAALSFSSTRKRQPAVTVWVYIDERDGRLLDFGLERTVIGPVRQLSFAEATSLMEMPANTDTPRTTANETRALLLVIERILKSWSEASLQMNEAARKRQARLKMRESHVQSWNGMADDESEGFLRTRGHLLVDSALDLYGQTLSGMLRTAGAPVPRATGADEERNGRLATGPLRRYIDGEAQRQALAVLCNLGTPLTLAECREVGKLSNDKRNAINNVRATRKDR